MAEASAEGMTGFWSRRGARARKSAGSRLSPSEKRLRVVSRRYHLHFPGLVYIATTVMLAFGAVQTQNNLLFWAFGIAVAGLVVSGIVSGSSLMGLELSRVGADATPVGGTVRIRYVLGNHARVFPAMALNIEELDAASKGRVWRMTQAVGSCTTVAPRSESAGFASSRALRRGVHKLGRVRVWTTYPIGLTKKSVTFEGPGEVVILPHAPALRGDAVEQLISADQRGAMTSPSRGISDEFWSLREYREGDPLRQVAWKPSARTGQLLVRQTAALTPMRIWIEIGAESGERFERAIALASGILRHGGERGWAVGLFVPSCGISIPPHDGARHMASLMRALALAEPGAGLPVAPGPKLGEAVVCIGRGGGAGRNRTLVALEHADGLLAPGQTLVPTGHPEISTGGGFRAWALGLWRAGGEA